MAITLYQKGSEQYFKDAVRHLEHYNGPLNTVVDIGAHIGSLSLMAADRGAKQVVAVEAMSINFEHLMINITNNDFIKVITPIHAMIVADANKERLLYCPGGPCGNCSMVVNQIGPTEQPPLIAFKYFLREFPVIDYLKIDIEGGEYELFDQSDELGTLLKRVRFLDLELHKLENYGTDYSHITKYSHSDASADELILYLRDIGFCEDPNPDVLTNHGKYAFGSVNYNFIGGWRNGT